MPSYLITGASRGLGLGFAAELLKNKNNIVIATARNTAGAEGLQKLKAEHNDGRLFLVDLDVTKPDSIRAAAEKTASIVPNGLDNLISNAGVSYNSLVSFEDLDMDEFLEEVTFNIKSPLLLIREFLPLISRSQSKKILILTSILGSIELGYGLPGLANAYAVAKAALNMLARKYSAELQSKGITTIIAHPGWVNSTEIGDSITEWIEKNQKGFPNITVEQSSEDVMKLLNGATAEDNGCYFNHDGTKLPW